MINRFYEINDGTYINCYGRGGHSGVDISEERYNAILDAVDNMPKDTDTTTYRLKVDLTYEPIAIDPVEVDIDDSEALGILMGVTE